MGNQMIPVFDSSSSSSPSSTRPSSPEIVHNTSNEGTTGCAFSSCLGEVSPKGQILHTRILIYRSLHFCKGSLQILWSGITKSTSNEGTHSGTGSVFSSRLDEVSPYRQVLPITSTLRIFSFAELEKATRKFDPDTVLGEGGFGRVFKGWIDEKTFAPTKAGSGMAIAVKKLNSEAFQGFEEWQSEVNILGSLSHPNIVRLLGHSKEDKELLLVYEFMPKGSLEKHLFSRASTFQSLSWSIRLKVAIGAARGLAFLHSSEKQIIYRDFKASNILLDLNYDAKISDFGLARHGPVGENSHVTTQVLGTYGYAAPEYVATGHLYVKSDVYSCGVVLLEMLSGMRVLDTSRPSGQHNLVDWAKPYLSNQRKVLSHVMDQRLEGQYPSKGAAQAAQLILKCLRSDPRDRPSMSVVVETLEQILAIKHMPQKPKNNPWRPTDHNHAHHHAWSPKSGNVGNGKNAHQRSPKSR